MATKTLPRCRQNVAGAINVLNVFVTHVDPIRFPIATNFRARYFEHDAQIRITTSGLPEKKIQDDDYDDEDERERRCAIQMHGSWREANK